MICCFSGTGNSLAVANMLSSQLGDEVMRIGKYSGQIVAADSHTERIIWVFPVHSWGMPIFFKKFMAECMLADEYDGATHYMVATCGDDAGLTHLMWRRAVSGRGWNAGGAFTVVMPNTYVALPGFDVDSKSVEAEKIAVARDRIESIARAISVGAKVDDVVCGAMPGLKTRVVYPAFMATLIAPSRFRCGDTCVGCGRCVSVCPLDNVKLDSDTLRPLWGRNCTMCMACYHACPHHAVEWGRFTSGKGQYLCQINPWK